MKIKLLDACNITTGKLDSNVAVECGKYPFFTCAPEPLRIDNYAFDDNVILLAGNNASGNFHCQRFQGKFNAYQRTYIITAKTGYDIDYIYYNLLINLGHLKKKAQGSQTKFLTMTLLNEFTIDDLSYAMQKKISTSLYNIDSKIALNNKIISELESMAKTLYDYWFLQFDFPDENGKPYKSSGGKMVYNEELKREIPEGWEVKSLSQVILSSKNGDWGNEISKAVNDVQVRCFRGADFSSIVSDYNLTAPIRFISESHRDRLLMDGDLVIEISGGSPTQATGRIGYINQSFLDRSDCAMTCSNFCKAFVPLSKNHQYWLYQIWKSYYDNGIMFNFESKTTGIKNLMFDDFCESIKVPVPCLELLQDYQNKVSAFYNLIQRSLNENSDLASLRDFLLPMLMNGQVTFKDAAEAHNN